MIRIFSDSTCDLSASLLERYQVTILPLHVVMGEQEYLDGISIGPDEIFAWADQNKTTPKTSAIAIDDAIEAMRPCIEAGDEIIAFCISEEMSTTGRVMRLAAQELEAGDRVSVIDSKNLSTGIGHLVIEAALMVQEGKSRRQIEEAITELIPRVRASFVVDTLTYLYRGGRCSGLTALAGEVLKIHPMIHVIDGKMGADKKYRGSLNKVILDYSKDLKESLLKAKKDRVFITHSGCNPELVEEVRSYLQDLHYFDEILETRAGSVVSSHCGPGTLGILFIAED